jgi:hypothetical protein
LLARLDLADVEIDRASGRKRRESGFIWPINGTRSDAAPTAATVPVAM